MVVDLCSLHRCPLLAAADAATGGDRLVLVPSPPVGDGGGATDTAAGGGWLVLTPSPFPIGGATDAAAGGGWLVLAPSPSVGGGLVVVLLMLLPVVVGL